MSQPYFLHQIKHNKDNNTWDKGIVVKAVEGVDNFEAAKQSYHAYLGAYAYGHDSNTDYVSCKITNLSGMVMARFDETWSAIPDSDIPEEF